MENNCFSLIVLIIAGIGVHLKNLSQNNPVRKRYEK